MKKSILLTCMLVAAIILSSTAFAQRNKKKAAVVPPAPEPVVVVVPPAPMFQNHMDTISYLLGTDIAKSFTKNGMNVNQEKLFQGFNDGMTKKDTLFTEVQVAAIMKAYQEEMMKVFQAKNEIALKKATETSKAFFTDNKAKEGIIEMPSGVQYKMMKEGTGAFPKETDKVTVHYKGTLLDGTVFDSSIERGEPITFPLNQVIKGWTEGMQKCKLGGKIQLFIPSDLAYGEKTQGPIPGGSALIFEVELLKIEAPAPEVVPEQAIKAVPAKKAATKSPAKTGAAKATVKPKAKPAVKPAVKK